MARTILVTYREDNIIYVSHGLNEDTLGVICMPPEPLNYYIRKCRAKLDPDLGEYYIECKDN